MAESQNRQILQDIQQKRQMLLNQGQAGAGNIGLVCYKSKLLRCRYMYKIYAWSVDKSNCIYSY